jgi:predicted NBD/HSP70 family sugar kinase
MDPPVDGAGVVTAAAAGDAVASEALRSVASSLGTSVAAAVALLDPGIVIISGGVADAFDVFGPLVREAMARHLPPHLRETEIRRGQLGSRAGLIGALIAARCGSETWAAVR